MHARHPRPPRVWLMTDERVGDALWPALERLPRGAGVVFRHTRTPPGARRALFERVRTIARRRGLVLLLAGDARTAAAWRADGVHNAPVRRTPRPMLRSRACHDRRALRAARDADVRFVSPLFATRSHPGKPPLGRVRAGLMVRGAGAGLIALGGMTARRARGLRGMGFAGWAAIDAWTAA